MTVWKFKCRYCGKEFDNAIVLFLHEERCEHKIIFRLYGKDREVM